MRLNATTLLLTFLAFISPLAQGCLVIGGTPKQEISGWWLDTKIWDNGVRRCLYSGPYNGGAKGITCTSGVTAWVQFGLKAPNPAIGQFAYAHSGQNSLNRIEGGAGEF